MKNLVFTERYGKLAASVEELLTAVVQVDGPLSAALRYGLLGGGKRLRGVLLLSVAELIECPISAVCSSVCACEIVHAASLIHDDLPALDNDDMRRGKPTCHRVFGEGIALLVGDALIAKAHQVLLLDSTLSAETRVALASELSSAVQRLCDGQALDLEQTGLLAAEVDSAALARRHRLKTGALFSFCAVAPMIIHQPSSPSSALACILSPDQLRDFGVQLGLLFQIADDILGSSSSTAQLGKRVGIDAARGVETFVSLYGSDGARKQAEEILDGLLTVLEAIGPRAEFLSALCHFALERER